MSASDKESVINTPEQAIQRLKQGNKTFINGIKNNADISIHLRESTAKYGQKPYAVILTCSDSRVPAELIFSAGIGELFVIRTAGNVVDEFDLGSIEIGVKLLGAKVVVIMGHHQCGAVVAALEGNTDGHIASIVNEIRSGLGNTTDAEKAENLNITHSYNKIMKSTIVTELIKLKEIAVLQAKYNIKTGKVDFL
ncbi:MAG: hypothetical protein LBI12_08255, partial [Treponema sp.]|jgi:carbonic anhydrase|nr:hypothetical protein [Treponema sp.]